LVIFVISAQVWLCPRPLVRVFSFVRKSERGDKQGRLFFLLLSSCCCLGFWSLHALLVVYPIGRVSY
jgi:hypothetical protein